MEAFAAEVFSRASLAHAISGAAGGTLAMLIVYPLDQLRLSAQLAAQSKTEDPSRSGGHPPATAGMIGRARWIIKHKGISELYRGLRATLVTLGASNFLYFYFYNGFKLFVRLRSGLPTIGPLINLVVASAASAINVTLTNPLWISANAVRTSTTRPPQCGSRALFRRHCAGRPGPRHPLHPAAAAAARTGAVT
jgi:hypothetical protein